MSGQEWNSVVSRRDKKSTREHELRTKVQHREDQLREQRIRAEAPHRPHRTRNLQWFEDTHPPPAMEEEEYEYHHSQRYGDEEEMINGKHRPGGEYFPHGSGREIAHDRYSESTEHRNRAQGSYNSAEQGYRADNRRLGPDQTRYYGHSSAGLLPDQHADLSSRALDLGDAAYRNGSLRTDFEDEFPYAHHSLKAADDHNYHAKKAFIQHKRATDNYDRHEKHRSSEDDDGQRDCYGNRVTAGSRPHFRSRKDKLPPRGRYSAW